MAAMDFSFRRTDRGTSVFWHILLMGGGVFCLLALVLFLADAGGEEVPHDESAEIIVNEGEEVVVGAGNSQAASNETDATVMSDEVTTGGPQPEGDVPAEDVEVEVAPGTPEGGETVAAEDETPVDANGVPQTGSQDAASIDEGIEGQGGGVEADQEEVVVDPDGTTAPTVPTPSGPEGSDDSALTQD